MSKFLLLIFISQCFSGHHTDTTHKYYKVSYNVYLTDVYVYFDIETNPKYYLEEVIDGLKRDFPLVRHEIQVQVRDSWRNIKKGDPRLQKFIPVTGVTYAFVLAYPRDVRYLPAIRFVTTNGTYTYYGVTDWETILRTFLADVRR